MVSDDSTFHFEKYSDYSNDLYSFVYPSHWSVEENIQDKIEGYEKYKGNDKMTYAQHVVDLITPDGVSFHVVKSNFHFDLPVSDYADLSVFTKGLVDAGEYQDEINGIVQNATNKYLDYWRYDSITFSGRPAELLVFELISPQNDTLIQKQIVVQNTKGDTFYINSTFHKGDEFAEAIGDEIFTTFYLK